LLLLSGGGVAVAPNKARKEAAGVGAADGVGSLVALCGGCCVKLTLVLCCRAVGGEVVMVVIAGVAGVGDTATAGGGVAG